MEDTNQDVNKNGTIPLGSQGLSALANSLEINATTPLKSSSLQLTFLSNHVEKPPLVLLKMAHSAVNYLIRADDTYETLEALRGS